MSAASPSPRTVELRVFLPRSAATTIWRDGVFQKPKMQEKRSDDYLVISDDLGLKWRSSDKKKNDSFEVKIRLYRNSLSGCEEWVKYTGLHCSLLHAPVLASSSEVALFKNTLTEQLQHLATNLTSTAHRGSEILLEAVQIVKKEDFDLRNRLLRVQKKRRQASVRPHHIKTLADRSDSGADVAGSSSAILVLEQAFFSVSKPFAGNQICVDVYRSICLEGAEKESLMLWILNEISLKKQDGGYLIAGYPQYLATLV